MKPASKHIHVSELRRAAVQVRREIGPRSPQPRLQELGKEPVVAVPASRGIERHDKEIRLLERLQLHLAIFAVGKMGPAAAEAAPQLQSLLNDEDRDIRLAVQLSLRRLYGVKA